MGTNSSYQAMFNVVRQSKGGSIFVPDDFVSYGTPDAVRSGLSRLCRNGYLIRFAKGVYYTPFFDKWDGTPLEPHLDDVAKKIALRDNARIIPTGSYALYRLGLSEQVPANIVYITDGSERRISFGKGRGIFFRHSNDLSNFAYQSRIMLLIVLAMREIGEMSITKEEIKRIKDIVEDQVSEQEFDHDIVLAPTWIKKILQA